MCRNDPLIRTDPAFGVAPRRFVGWRWWRRWCFAFQPSLLLAQVQMTDPDRVQTKPKAAPPAKKASRKTPTDNVSDDLNRREAERAKSVVRSLSAPAAQPAPRSSP